MQSIALIPGSDGTTNASLMTVQNLRAPGATTIVVNTVTGVPAKFYGSMGTPHNFTDPVTGETITVISDATAVDFAGHVNVGNLIIDAIAPGYADTRGSTVGDIVIIRPVTEWANNIFNVLNKSLNDDGSIKDTAVIYQPTVADYIQSGGVWSALSGLNAAMTALTAYQGGRLSTIAAVATRAFTASKDTYVDILRTTTGYTTVFSLAYTEVANNATAPTLAANSIRLAKVVTNGSTVTSVIQTGLDAVTGNPFRNLSIINLLSTIFSSSVQTSANTGSAGGSMQYLNLGGIKLIWGQSAVLAMASSSMVVNFPTGFLSGITLPALASISQIGGSWDQRASAANTTTTGCLLGLNGGGTNGAVSYIVIGY